MRKNAVSHALIINDMQHNRLLLLQTKPTQHTAAEAQCLRPPPISFGPTRHCPARHDLFSTGGKRSCGSGEWVMSE